MEKEFPIPLKCIGYISELTVHGVAPIPTEKNAKYMKIPAPETHCPALFPILINHIPTAIKHIETAPTVEQYLHTNPQDIKSVVTGMVKFISRMQKKCRHETHCPAFHRRFDDAKYQFEFDFHVAEQLLRFYFQMEYAPEVLRDFAREICTVLDINENIFVHRDFQSSNVFITKTEKPFEYSVIDFQDARYGTPVYDLVSCLWDSYIPISQDLREKLVKQFYETLGDVSIDWSWDVYQKMVDYSIIQRKLHDAGAFAYNYRRFASRRYVGYVTEAIAMALTVMRKYPHFSDAVKLFEKCK